MKKLFLCISIICLFKSAAHVAAQPGWTWGVANFNGCASAMSECATEYFGETVVDDYGNTYATGTLYADTGHFGSAVVFSLDSGISPSFITKTDGAGHFLWTRYNIHGSMTPLSLRLRNGCLYFLGVYAGNTVTLDTVTLTSSGPYQEYFMAKYTTDGQLLWAKNICPTSTTQGAATLDADGNIYVTGAYYGLTAVIDTIAVTGYDSLYEDMFCARFDSDLHVVWVTTATGAYSQIGQKISMMGQNGLLVAMESDTDFTMDTATISGHYNSKTLLKISTQGVLEWYESAGGIYFEQLLADRWGHNYVIGDFSDSCLLGSLSIHSLFGILSSFAAKLDTFGNTIWETTASGGYRTMGVSLDSCDHVWLIGSMGSIGSPSSVAFDPVHYIAPPIPAYDAAFVAALDSAGNYLYGFSMPTGGDDNVAIVAGPSTDVTIVGDMAMTLPLGVDTLLKPSDDIEVYFMARFRNTVACIPAELPLTGKQYDVRIFPVPCSGYFQVSLQKGVVAGLSITDLYGSVRMIADHTEDGTIISTRDFPDGMYLCTFTTTDGQRTTQKLTVLHH